MTTQIQEIIDEAMQAGCENADQITGYCSAGRRKLTRNDKLHAYWSKRESDVILYSPLGQQTTCDGAFLAGVLNKTFTDELERRGYDVSTLRFSIAPKQGNERFASQR